MPLRPAPAPAPPAARRLLFTRFACDGKDGGMRAARRWKPGPVDLSNNSKGCHANLIENGVAITKWLDKSCNLDDGDTVLEAADMGLEALIDEVRAMLTSINDGEITMSPYDTAWVALIPRLDGGEGPQFPSTVEWIVDNQLPDGSWGDAELFSAYDRLINSLGCVTVLTLWCLEPEKCQTGLSFLQENIWRLAEEDPESMPIGFEIAFPSLLEMAKTLSIDFPYDHSALQSIYATRKIKLKRIPKDMMHSVPTSILHSLEGMPGLDWDKLLKLQSSDGSFLFSPSATAYAVMRTGDKKCFEYLDRIVKRFNGGVPNVYPVDLFEHIWVVDRLERLGISRYFLREIEDCLDYVKRHWTVEGICWARNSKVSDVDDTAMAFRLLRLHGYNVSPSVFKNFEKDGEFFCFMGQSTQAVTGMYNLHRASQISFLGEDVLQRARVFTYKFLREREAAGTLRDKWIISKDLPGEVEYALDFPWYASLPRVEARTYLDQYGGKDVIWIGKTLYRMPLVNNTTYLELARQDFNRCQVLHQLEWHGLQKWYAENGLEAFGLTRDNLLRAYFLATACIFEPNRANERLGWTRGAVLADTILVHLSSDLDTKERKKRFICNFIHEDHGDLIRFRAKTKDEILVRALLRLIDVLAREAAPVREGQKYIHRQLRSAWIEWMMQQDTSLLLVRIIEICAGRIGDVVAPTTDGSDVARLCQLTSSICDHLHKKAILFQGNKKNEVTLCHIDKQVDLEMQELAHCVLQRSSEKTNSKTKQTFLDVVKSYYYAAHCPQDIIDRHISKVIFEQVI